MASSCNTALTGERVSMGRTATSDTASLPRYRPSSRKKRLGHRPKRLFLQRKFLTPRLGSNQGPTDSHREARPNVRHAAVTATAFTAFIQPMGVREGKGAEEESAR